MVYFEFSADKTVKSLLLFRCESFNKNLTVWRFFSLIALERLKQIKIKTSPTKHKQTERFPDRWCCCISGSKKAITLRSALWELQFGSAMRRLSRRRQQNETSKQFCVCRVFISWCLYSFIVQIFDFLSRERFRKHQSLLVPNVG